MRVFCLFVCLILLLGSVAAVGVTPGKMSFEYVPGEVAEGSISVVNSGGGEISVAVFTQGALSEEISLSDVSFVLSEERKAIQYSVRMPFGLEPGEHEGEIVVMQLPSATNGEMFIGAASGVATKLSVNVPFPGKFVEGGFEIYEQESVLQFAIPVVSKGDLDIARVGADVEIFSSLNERVVGLKTTTVPLASKQRSDLTATWNPDVAPGPYRAVATVVYDEETLTLEKEFDVGAEEITLEGIAVNDFSLGEIAKFEVFVKNHWNQEITDAFVEMQIFNDDGAVLAAFNSANYDLAPLEKTLMVAFWDTEGVSEGVYDSRLFVRYGERSEEESLELDVRTNEIKIIGAGFVLTPLQDVERTLGSTTLIWIVGVLIAMNLAWFVFLRKRFGKRK